jgi:hypothetical protein
MAAVTLTIEAFRMGTTAAAAPAFWASAAVAVRAAPFLGALLSRAPPLGAWGCASRIRGFLFLADQTGTGRGAKANIGGQHHEGRCGERAKHELHDGLLLLVTKGAVSSPCPGVQARQTRGSRVIQCVLPVFGRLVRC